MNWIERTIEAVSPRWAAERAYYRAQLDFARGYDAAKGGRRRDGWLRPTTSANAEVGAAGAPSRASARELVRNNPLAKKAKRSYVANMVGTGIVPRAKTGNKVRDGRIDAAFEEWSKISDADGMLTFYGQQGLVAGALFESGEVLNRFRDRPVANSADPYSLRLQILEPDYIDSSRFGQTGAEKGSIISQGIEFDAQGRRVAYYLWNEHPGDMAAGLRAVSLKSSRIPAEQILHVYRVDRPGQIRGITELAAALQKSYDLADYEEAELVRKKIAACFAAFVKQARAPGATTLTQSPTSDAQGRRIERLSPGLIQYLGLDEDVVFGAPPAADGYGEFIKAHKRDIAAGVNVTYEEMTGDFSQVNYSSFRAGQNGYRRAIEMDQWLILIPMFCDPAWRRFIDRLALAGVIDRPAYGVEWETPRFESVDPYKDSIADRNDVRSGFVSLFQAIQRRGYNPREVLQQAADANALLDQLGLTLDSDPRRVSSSGLQQQVQPDNVDTAGSAAAVGAN